MSRSAVIISDVHLGSAYCCLAEFLDFMRNLPPEADLVLNGDVVDRWHHKLPPEHEVGLDALRRESHHRRVVWVRGNHDDGYVLENPEKVAFAGAFNLGRDLYAAHGYDFDNILTHHRLFVRFFRAMHHLRLRLGAEPVHVAYYAKKFRPLYNVLRRHVAANAVEFAVENGYAAVTCGHTHYAEDLTQRGVRYVNTGSWTEKPICYLEVNEQGMTLKEAFT